MSLRRYLRLLDVAVSLASCCGFPFLIMPGIKEPGGDSPGDTGGDILPVYILHAMQAAIESEILDDSWILTNEDSSIEKGSKLYPQVLSHHSSCFRSSDVAISEISNYSIKQAIIREEPHCQTIGPRTVLWWMPDNIGTDDDDSSSTTFVGYRGSLLVRSGVGLILAYFV